ncbi:MAG: type II toxin-antitoxin system HicA family toxin [Marinobacterium sp.]|nr:type II toxin-antitoxin system HicA family toxin [Marinobacterium sp.]
MNSRDLIKLLEKNGWVLLRVKGSHHHYTHPDNPGRVVTVPHPRRNLATGLVKTILKQSGLS